MKLTKVVLTGYRSVKGTEEILLDNKVNILIGANDHGKSNILAAIKCLNDTDQITEDDKNWDLAPENAVRLQWHFSYEANDLEPFRTPPPVPVQEGVQDPSNPEVISAQPLQLNDSNELIYYREGVGGAVKVHSVPFSIQPSFEPELLKLRPKVELFEAPKTNLIDQVSLAELTTINFEFMQGIFMLAGIWDLKESIFTQDDRTSRILDEASKRLTKVLNGKWNQGKDLTWKLKHTGTNGDHIKMEIDDPSVSGRYIRPSLKSSGFQTYFLISMIVLARTKDRPGQFIYLFDEPGTYLHPHAQTDW